MPSKLNGKDIPTPPSITEASSMEWLLHSSTIQDAELIRALVLEYYQELYQLALGYQADPNCAFEMTVGALAWTVHLRDEYWGDIPLDKWIAGFIQKIAKQKKWLKRKSRALQTGGNPAQAEEMAVQSAVKEALDELRRRAKRSLLIRKALLSSVGLAAALFLLWMAGINQVISLPNPADKVRFYYTYQTLPGDTLASISKLSGVSIQDIRSGNDIPPGKELEAGMSLRLPSLNPGYWQRLFPRRAAAPPSSLSLASTPAVIKKRIQDSWRYWDTLWVDRYVIQYGPPGIIAPPVNALRQQIWVQQPGEALLMQKNLIEEGDTEGIYFDGNRIHEKSTVGPNAQTIFVPNVKSTLLYWALNKSLLSDYSLPFMPPSPGGDWQVRLVGMEVVAGFDALVVDQYGANDQRQARWWVEARRGVILAERAYATPYTDLDTQPIRYEKVVTRVQFGVKIDPSYLNPENFYPKLVKNPADAPLAGPYESIPLAPFPSLRFAPAPSSFLTGFGSPPAGFDRNASRLALRLKVLPGDNPFDTVLQSQETSDQSRPIDVFGDEYYLGTFTLPLIRKPYFSSCDRSPDGSLVVLSPANLLGNLYWFRLSAPQEIHSIAHEASSAVYAISPSSRWLALFGCRQGLVQGCGISLLDFDTGVVTRLVDVVNGYPIWLGWSHDGQELAEVMLNFDSPDSALNASLKIFALGADLKAKPVYVGPFNLYISQPAANSPLTAWGKDFQPDFGFDYYFKVMKGCALP